MTVYTVKWVINAEADNPREAAEWVWYHIFKRSTPMPDDACVFKVCWENHNGEFEDVIDLTEPSMEEWINSDE